MKLFMPPYMTHARSNLQMGIYIYISQNIRLRKRNQDLLIKVKVICLELAKLKKTLGI